MSNIEKVENYLKECPVFFLTTVDGNKPKCRPIAFHMLSNDKIYFGIGSFKEVYKQMQNHPYIELCAQKDTGFLRYYGKAVFEADDTIANMVLSHTPAMQKIYNEQTGYQLKIFHLENATAEFRSQLGVEEKIEF
ncbi:MAG TPA: pyridoxamine 5'-phosphate oxidase family protein [Firmicutes bacterium]|nr:pyridoxamine 5'-phosphate oxidase family protein [Bacillales bacterium]HJA41143.1 pyridoxamine 5'-phosphate oxidase family protein [Bacillota bacterium]